MDPDAALERMREIHRRMAELDRVGTTHADEWERLARELWDLTEGLDQWLSRGGYIPAEWSAPARNHY